MADLGKLQAIACKAIDELSQELDNLSQQIWQHPEQNFNEVFAHKLLTQYLQEKGFQVHSKCGDLKTAFKAVYSKDVDTTETRRRVGIVCEYDALPEINHACGHNLIAEAGIAAAMGIKAAIDTSGDIGELVVFGTPAEEGGGGKIYMLDDDCFDDVDFCMMVHPSAFDCVAPAILANQHVTITFHGHAAHAAAFPWEGVNALDAAVACYTSISNLRQQMKPTWRAHCIFQEGGTKPNIIPDRTVLNYYFRADKNKDLDVLLEKAKACWEGAAMTAGCTCEVKYENIGKNEQRYCAMNTNMVLAKLYQKHAESMGVTFPSQTGILGSTDMANVSLIKPSIHPVFSIDTPAVIHTRAFNTAASKPEAQPRTLIAGKAMAMTSIEVLADPKLLKAIVDEFEQTKNNN